MRKTGPGPGKVTAPAAHHDANPGHQGINDLIPPEKRTGCNGVMLITGH